MSDDYKRFKRATLYEIDKMIFEKKDNLKICRLITKNLQSLNEDVVLLANDYDFNKYLKDKLNLNIAMYAEQQKYILELNNSGIIGESLFLLSNKILKEMIEQLSFLKCSDCNKSQFMPLDEIYYCNSKKNFLDKLIICNDFDCD